MLSWKTGREIKKFSGIEVIRVINVCSFKAKVRFIYRLIDLSRVLNFFQHFFFFLLLFQPFALAFMFKRVTNQATKVPRK